MWLKVCGIQDIDTGVYLASNGVDAIGINRYPDSSRFVDEEFARALSLEVERKNPSVMRVGVYVNEEISRVREEVEDCSLDAVQLHGDESPDVVDQLSQDTKVIKAFRVGPDFSEEHFERYDPWAYLLDAKRPDQYGGTGETAPWERIRPWTEHHRIILAGGLSPGNIEVAFRTVKPWGLDVNSQLEDESGKKDRAKLKKLLSVIDEIQ